MIRQDIDIAINRFRRRQRLLRLVFVLVLTSAMLATFFIVAYSHERSMRAEEAADKAAKNTEVTFDKTSDQVAMLDAAAKANDSIKLWAEQIRKTGSTAQKVDAEKIIDNAGTIASQLENSISSSKTTQLAQDEIIQGAYAKASGPGKYGIVVSADRQEVHTVEAVEQLRKRGFDNIAVYFGHGPLRTVVHFETAAEAHAQLPQIQQYRSTAYLVNLDKWCSNQRNTGKPIANAPVFSCE